MELGNLPVPVSPPPPPIFLGRKQAWNGEATPESRSAFWGAPVRRPSSQGWDACLFARVGDAGEWEPRDFPEAHPRPVEDTLLITRFDAKHNHSRSFVYTQYKLGGAGWRSKLQPLNLRKSWSGSGFFLNWIGEKFGVWYLSM